MAGILGVLPVEVLDREDVQRALAEHDFASAFALFKKWGGLSQNRIAAACQLTPGKVSTIISGQQQITSFEVIARIADGLRIPGGLMRLAPRPWEREDRPQEENPSTPPGTTSMDEATWQSASTVDLATRLTRSDLVMDRRAVAQALAATAVTGATLLDSGGLATAGRSRGRTEARSRPAGPPRSRATGGDRPSVSPLGPPIRWWAPQQGRDRAAQ